MMENPNFGFLSFAVADILKMASGKPYIYTAFTKRMETQNCLAGIQNLSYFYDIFDFEL